MRRPQRLHRTRRVRSQTPPGAIYVGRPTMWSNPFAYRARIGHQRSIILYRAWVSGDLNSYILGRAGFSDAEVRSLDRWRDQLIRKMLTLRGRDLQCWCPLTSDWCHAETLLRVVNAS